VELETSKAQRGVGNGERGILSRLGDLGKCRKLPSGVRAEPGRKTILGHRLLLSEHVRTALVAMFVEHTSVIFWHFLRWQVDKNRFRE